MELDHEQNAIKLETPAEYIVVMGGFKAGIRYYELKAEHERTNVAHDARLLSSQALKSLHQAYDDMPVLITREVLPYAMPIDHAKVALKGVEWNRRQPESREAKLSHRAIGNQLAKLLLYTRQCD